ncbi:hypothetical protein POM88_023574 [Heracleum sosnowskyi]|uniref:Cystatin domain-containing protein n=1 Tax=Heracleum sosnowskyi TaxID=360622 RepID=A0AAD8IHA7_9APIA|nr:hypothetical protein POM88_023574 [Heracleum sosnowskyi]
MRRNIYSQRPEDDDEEMKEELNDILKHYHPDIVSQHWMEERYCILERRQYKIDVNTTDGFEVGVYPYLAKKACSLIHRYYCPPDTTLPDYAIANLNRLANEAIHLYNSKEGSNYTVVRVIKTMTEVASGTWYYMTFQASLPFRRCPCRTFEAKLFEHLPFPRSYIHIEFVRLKIEAGGSSMMHQQPT